jgi:hypothetical protein
MNWYYVSFSRDIHGHMLLAFVKELRSGTPIMNIPGQNGTSQVLILATEADISGVAHKFGAKVYPAQLITSNEFANPQIHIID